MNDIERKLARANGTQDRLYSARVVELIRLKYNINEELALLRQRDTKPEEFAEYNDYVEECKAQAKAEIMEGGEDNR